MVACGATAFWSKLWRLGRDVVPVKVANGCVKRKSAMVAGVRVHSVKAVEAKAYQLKTSC